MRGMGIRETKSIMVVSSPIRSRGCAEVGAGQRRHRNEGERVVIAIAPPSRFSLNRLANLVRHELGHTIGFEHEKMPYTMQWSIGPLPAWAKPFDQAGWPRYLGRAPDSLEK